VETQQDSPESCYRIGDIQCQLGTPVCNKQSPGQTGRREAWLACKTETVHQSSLKFLTITKPLSCTHAACTPQHRGQQSQTGAGKQKALPATSAPTPDKLVLNQQHACQAGGYPQYTQQAV